MDRIALLLLNPLSFTFGSLGGGSCKLDQGATAGEFTNFLIHVKFMELHERHGENFSISAKSW